MNRYSLRAVVPLAFAACIVATASTSSADEVVVVHEHGAESGGIGSSAVVTGIVVFGASYGTSVVVASESTHHGDSHLFVPILGPWLDFTDRGNCGPLTNSACDNETTYKVLLVADGVLQAVGVLSFVGGLLSPSEPRGVAKAPARPKIQIAPAQFGKAGAGLAAVGTF